MLKNIIKIQSVYRGYCVRKNLLIPSSYYQTKIWRQNQVWYKDGRHNECEKYQSKILQKITNLSVDKTNHRINIKTFDIEDIKHPLKLINGFEFTENFDAIMNFNNKVYYFNLKFVCDNGGAQTRSLREVYHFITAQINYFSKNINSTSVYFINILDGNTCYENINKFTYLLSTYDNKNIFVGDMCNFQTYWKKHIKQLTISQK